jgi:Ca-activated chloride channel family protein
MQTLELFHFLRPYWLWMLIPVVILLMLALRSTRSHVQWEKLCDKELLPYILDDRTTAKRRWPMVTFTLATILSVLALAGPSWQRLPSPIFHNNAALVIALDLSRSMDTTDIKPSRLIRARYKITDILNKRKDGLTALLVYAGDAFTVTPLTDDTQTIESQLSALTTDIMPSQGSNIRVAIQHAVDLLKQADQTQGDIVFITDGIDKTQTANIQSLLGSYRLSILGVGTTEGAPIPLGRSGQLLKDNNGNIIIPKLEPKALASLAHTGGGIYRTLSNDDSDINAILALLDNDLPRSAMKTDQLFNTWDDKGPWLLLLVIALVLPYFRKGLLVLPLVILTIPQPSYAFDWQDLWQTQEQQAQTLFEQGKYKEAQQKFQTPEWKAAAQYKAGDYEQATQTLDSLDSAETFYNKGNALAKSNQLEDAISAYKHALEIDPQHEDALYNKKLVEQALQQALQQQQQQDSNSKENNQQNDQQSKSEQDKQQQNQDGASQDDAEQKQQNEQQSKSEQEQHSATPHEMTEKERANAQWLQRIPDDPSGLLKRKFKYQYQQRKPSQRQEQQW